MAKHLKPLDKDGINLWSMLAPSEEEDAEKCYINDPDKGILLTNCFFYSFFASIDATILMYACTSTEASKDLKKKRAGFIRTLKWIVKYHEMLKGLEEL